MRVAIAHVGLVLRTDVPVQPLVPLPGIILEGQVHIVIGICVPPNARGKSASVPTVGIRHGEQA